MSVLSEVQTAIRFQSSPLTAYRSPLTKVSGSLFSAVCLNLGAWIFLASAATAGERPQIIWHENYATASAEARALGRPIMLYFTGKWCPACLRVERTSFMDKRVVEFISANLIAVRMDLDASPELIENWTVEHLPTTQILTRDGRVQGKIEGFRPVEKYLAELKSSTTAAQRKETIPESATEAKSTNLVVSKPQSLSQPSLDEPIELATRSEKTPFSPGANVRISLQQEPNLALNGTCVVTIVENHRIVSGDPQFSVEFEGATYWFAGAHELEKFQADPTHYTPILSGLCAISLVDDGCERSGSIRCAAIYRDRLFLFAGPDQRRRFQANPARYVGIAIAGLKKP